MVIVTRQSQTGVRATSCVMCEGQLRRPPSSEQTPFSSPSYPEVAKALADAPAWFKAQFTL